MRTLLIILAIVLLASCAPQKQLVSTEVYYDSTYARLTQIEQYNRAAKIESRKFLSRQTVAVIGLSAFGVYCILAWRYDIE